MRSPRLSGRQAGESINPGEDGFASPSFGLLSKIKCGSLPFPHCGTAEGPLCLWAGGFTLTLSVFLGFSIEAGCAPGWVWSPVIICLLRLFSCSDWEGTPQRTLSGWRSLWLSAKGLKRALLSGETS